MAFAPASISTATRRCSTSWRGELVLADVNVLVYAYHEDASGHAAYRDWLQELVNSDETYAVSDHILSGFLRIVTHAGVFDRPSPLDRALEFAVTVRDRPNAVPIAPGPRHWDIFVRLCRDGDARGNLVPDAFVAALAVEAGSELVTADRGFARFPGLRWRHPLA